MPLKIIRLELARSKDNPEGDSGHAYELRAPLDDAGHLDRVTWPLQKELCTIRKYEKDAEVQSGLLLHTRSGKWVFSYEKGESDDEAVFRLSSHTFVPGEYISITEHDGIQRTFRIVSVEPWHPVQADGVKAARWPKP